MELKIDTAIADYRLVFFQPEPESGERLCIALVFTETNGKRTLLFDDRFSRVRCFAPSFETDLLRFLMRSVEEQLHDPSTPLDQSLLGLGSQLSFSPERRIASPITERTKVHLLDRFVTHGGHDDLATAETASLQRVRRDAVFVAHVLSFARPLLNNGTWNFVERASSSQVFGQRLPGVGKVSLMISTQDSVTVLDGVDLSIQSPKEVVKRTGQVAHTFWQYGRYSKELVLPKQMNRVAVIFDGGESPNSEYRDAHLYAQDILSKESELVIEDDHLDDLRRLDELVGA
jgi:hypothetical protein